jgi:hypothetical protein
MNFSRSKEPIMLACALFLIFGTLGCESLGRKFVRKPKADDKKNEEVVFAPEEYKTEGVSHEDLYRQFFLYWKSWHDEVIDSLEKNGNRKRQVDSLNEAIKNLWDMKSYLKTEAAAKLEVSINQMIALRYAVTKDDYGNNVLANRRQAERLKRDILRDFSFNKIKNQML